MIVVPAVALLLTGLGSGVWLVTVAWFSSTVPVASAASVATTSVKLSWPLAASAVGADGQ